MNPKPPNKLSKILEAMQGYIDDDELQAKARSRAQQEIEALVAAEVIKELEWVLSKFGAFGYAPPRRVIEDRIKELRGNI